MPYSLHENAVQGAAHLNMGKPKGETRAALGISNVFDHLFPDIYLHVYSNTNSFHGFYKSVTASVPSWVTLEDLSNKAG